MSKRIVVTGWLPEPALDILRQAGEVEVHQGQLAPEQVRDAVRGAHAVVSMVHIKVDQELLAAAGPQLEVVANVGVGYDNIDVAAAAARGVTVTNTPGVLVDATADLTIGLMLMVTRRLGEGERLLRARRPWSFHLGFMLGTGLQHKTLGIVGMGRIGRAVCRRARAFGMKVVYNSRRPLPEQLEAELSVYHLPLDELLSSSDVVSLHCPLTEQTHHLIDQRALELMKPSAFLVNTSRGAVVDEKALVKVLQERRIAGAALDVFEREPQVEPELLEMDNVVVVPHLGSATTETRTSMAELAARNVAAVLSGDEPLTPVRA